MFVRMDKQVETQLDVEFLKELYSIAKDFANWMDKSGFPERFPPSINHTGRSVCHGGKAIRGNCKFLFSTLQCKISDSCYVQWD